MKNGGRMRRRNLVLGLIASTILGAIVAIGSSTSSGANTVSPTVTSLSPTIGPTGTEVSVFGTGLDTTTGVAFNGVPAYFQIVSSTELTAIAPETGTTGDVTVATSQGPASSSEPFTFVEAATLPGTAWMSLVDQRTGHVYVSCPDTGTISVFDYAGHLVDTVSGEPGAEGMAVVGGTLYVSQNTTGSITEINTTTLTPVGALATGLGSPGALVYAGGYLWVYGGSLDRVDPSTRVTTSYSGDYFSDNNDPASLRSDPANPDTLVAVSTQVSSLDAAAASPTWTRPTMLYRDDAFVGNVQDSALTPDGSEIELGGDGKLLQFSYPSLAATSVTYGNPAGSVTAVAVSPGDGGLVAAGFDYGANAEAVAIYPLAGGSELFSARIGNEPGEHIGPRTVAFDPTGTALFAVVVSQTLPETFRAFPLPSPTSTPTISSVWPSSGVTSGGETVTISGSGFTGANKVKFGGTDAISFTVISSNEIQAVSPPATAGTADVSVVTSDGSTATVDADEFTYNLPSPPPPPPPPPTSPSFTNAPTATALVGSPFVFPITTTVSTSRRITCIGRLPRGIRYRSTRTGTTSLFGTPRLNRRSSTVTYPLTFTATFGRGRSKQVVKQSFTLVVSPHS